MKVLWIALVWPEPDSSAGGFRTTQLIEALIRAGHEVRISSPCRTNPHRDQLESQGISTVVHQPNDSGFDAYIVGFRPDIVLFDRFMVEEQFGWRVREQCPNAVRILDTIDLHSLRRTRQKKLREFEGNEGSQCFSEVSILSPEDLHSDDALREISAIYRSDLSLIISDFEQRLLQSRYSVPSNLLELCRFSYPAPTDLKDFPSRTHFVAIGNFHHGPNRDSFHVLHQKLWKRIKEQMRNIGEDPCELHVYGAYPTKEFMSLDDPSTGFRVKGWTPDALETLRQYRVNLAPLRFGAGIKGKVADGWSVGTPCVGTSIAAEGMHESLAFGGCIEDDWDKFAHQAVMLYSRRATWEEAQKRGVAIIRRLFDEETSHSRFMGALENAVVNRDVRRRENFVGAMLWHHQNRSTEFFSRWIEVKNKLASHMNKEEAGEH